MKQHSFCASNCEFLEKQNELVKMTSSDQDSDQVEHFKKEIGIYPKNVTFWNYWDFLLIPTFVYQLSYPRTERFRPYYFLVKLLSLISTFSLLYLLTEHYIQPVLNKMAHETIYESLIQLAMPFGCGYILLFFLIFECVTNLFAEITL